jgi:hypothetical protein
MTTDQPIVSWKPDLQRHLRKLKTSGEESRDPNRRQMYYKRKGVRDPPERPAPAPGIELVLHLPHGFRRLRDLNSGNRVGPIMLGARSWFRVEKRSDIRAGGQ